MWPVKPGVLTTEVAFSAGSTVQCITNELSVKFNNLNIACNVNGTFIDHLFYAVYRVLLASYHSGHNVCLICADCND